ncbi:MAG: sugar kinase [Planctomycetes bacterium]|nr:sugar kinase [Planctomycetota bacterium]
MNLLVVGTIALDTVETPFGSATEILGGSATYFSLAASLFSKVRLVGVVGTDFPARHLEVLKTRSIDLAGLQRANGRTFRWSGRYHEDMNTRDTLDTQLNVLSDFDPKLPEDYRPSRFVFLANDSPGRQMKTLQQLPDRQFTLLDTMNYWISSDRPALLEMLGQVDGLIVNDEEAKDLAGEKNLIAAGNKILRMGPKVLIVKKGEHGSFLFSSFVQYAIPAFPLEQVVDPTGAGDSYAGGFMGYLARAGRVTIPAIKKAMVFGTIAASFSVEKFGPERLVEIDRGALDDRYEQFVQFISL